MTLGIVGISEMQECGVCNANFQEINAGFRINNVDKQKGRAKMILPFDPQSVDQVIS